MKLARRDFFLGARALLLGLAASKVLGSGTAQAQQRVTILSQEVPQVPLDPQDALWQQAEPIKVEMSSQVVVKPRHYEASAKELLVRSLYDSQRVGFLVEWQDRSQDTGLGQTLKYRDAVALQFPTDWGKRTPYFGMGEPGNPVTIYQWKADWQLGPQVDADEGFPNIVSDFYPFSGKAPGEIAEGSDYTARPGAWPADPAFNPGWAVGNPISNPALKKKTSVEKLTALGFGSLTSQEEQDGLGQGSWQEGKWRVVLSLPRRQGDRELSPGLTIPIAFAAWDGSNQERGGEKAISSWYFLAFTRPAPVSRYFLPVLAAGAIGALQWVAIRRLRQKARG